MITTDYIKEILGSDPAMAYVEVAAQIAEKEQELNGHRGWFWKKPLLTDPEQKRVEAELKLLRIAQAQIASSLSEDIGGGKVKFKVDVEVCEVKL